MGKITIDPITRIEGHLKVEATVENGEVKDARSSGTLFRGFELILRGRDPRDASQLTQRICGVCPQTHATASVLCLDSAFGIADKITDNGRIMRNLLLGANYIQSHVLHFYHLAALDFVDVTKVADYEGTIPPSSPSGVSLVEANWVLSRPDTRATTACRMMWIDRRRPTTCRPWTSGARPTSCRPFLAARCPTIARL